MTALTRMRDKVASSAAPVEIAGRVLKRDLPLVPSDVIAKRALVTVIAIMTFLAALTSGGVSVVANASRNWRSAVSSEMTIQVRPTPGKDLDALAKDATEIARTTRGIKAVDAYSPAESAALLQPWLGSDLDLADLPVPRLIVLTLDPDAKVDVIGLRTALLDKVPGASLDDHGMWVARLATMARVTVLLGLGIFALVLAAMMLAVAFATRGAMAGANEVIEILHFVGAADSFISRQFQTHFLRLGLRGGAIGGGAAILFFVAVGRLATLGRTTASGEQIEALFGTFGLEIRGYVAILLIAAGIAVLTGIVSRVIVYRHLRTLM